MAQESQEEDRIGQQEPDQSRKPNKADHPTQMRPEAAIFGLRIGFRVVEKRTTHTAKIQPQQYRHADQQHRA